MLPQMEDRGLAEAMACPRRPKWRFDMTKVEVEKNEEGLFKKWIDSTDKIVEEWQKGPQKKEEEEGEEDPKDEPAPELSNEMPRSPTYFERNLEVWRQLYVFTYVN